jgi:hypothetical protein
MSGNINSNKSKLKIPWWAITIICILAAIGLGFGIYFIVKALQNNNTPSSDIKTVSSPAGQNAVLEMSNQVRSTCGCTTNIISSPSGNIPSAPINEDCINTVPPLTWDDKLEDQAISYSKLMAKCNCMSHYLYNGCDGCNSSSGESTYDQNPESGQNLAKITTVAENPLSEENIYLTALSGWANEGWNGHSDDLNHYTAMNWKNGTTLGCGISSVEKGDNITYYVTCQYGADSDENIPNLQNYTHGNVLCTIPINVANN